MKILQVIARLDSGGAERVFVDTCNMLYKRGHDVSILFTRSHGELCNQINSKVPIISLERKNKYSLSAMYRMARIVENFDIIHVHLRYNLLYLKLALMLSRNRSRKIIFHDHFGQIDVDKRIPLYFYFFRKNYIYVGVSRSLSDWAIKHLGIKSHNVHTLPNIRLVDKVGEQKDIKSSDTLKLVHVSNIHPIKNIEFSLEVVNNFSKSRNVHLTVYGNKSDSEYFDKLNRIIKEYDIEDKVKFIFDENDIPSILNQYNFGLYTSRSESGPLVIIEYLSQGLPFITFETGEVIEQIKDKYPYMIMNNFNAIKWSNQMKKILSLNPSAELIRTFRNTFSSDSYCSKLIDIYKSTSK